MPTPAAPPTLAQLRRYALARTFFPPTTLGRAIEQLGFVQADPIRAPARAQDLTLRHRVRDYRAGDLERRYARLDIEEDFFVNYGFLPRRHQALMHPRRPRVDWPPERLVQAEAVLEFVRAHGEVHPREVDAHFAHGKTRNWFGGSSNATTQLLDAMHYRGLIRVARRAGGTRVYAVRDSVLGAPGEDAADTPAARMDALLDLVVAKYAPLPAASLGQLASRLGGGAPQWVGERAAALARVRARLTRATVDGTTWFWPADENPRSARWRVDDTVRLLAPFDPAVWDRRRFELFWGWAYRFEAYTPAVRRRLGYYALPLLWRDRVIGWANAQVRSRSGRPPDDAAPAEDAERANGTLDIRLGFVAGHAPCDSGFGSALEAEVARLRRFLGLTD